MWGYRREKQLLYITLVCKTWCQAARVTHELWSSFSLDTYSPASSPAYEAVRSWLSRSGGLPKSLRVDGFDCSHCKNFQRDDGDFWCPIIHPELVKLLSEGPVLNHLSLMCPLPLCYKKLCERLHPSLWNPINSLSIRIEEGPNEMIEGEVRSNSFDIPPDVTSLEIDMGHVSSFGSPGLPLGISPSVYARLKSFSFNGVTWGDARAFLQALHHCKSLEIMTISFGQGWGAFDGGGHRAAGSVSLPCLRTLHLRHAWKTDIFKFLTLPALTELVVRGEEHELGYFWWGFPNPELRCPNLRIFRFYTPRAVDPLELAATLKNLPHLTELTLSRAVSDRYVQDDDYDDVVEQWHRHGEEPEARMRDVFQILRSWDQKCGVSRILPSLQVLEILDLPSNYDFSHVCKFISARLTNRRRQANDTLKELTVTFLPAQTPNNCISSDFKNVHEELEKRGIRASITPSELKPRRGRRDWYDESLYFFWE
ncbi:hypothetical protein H1R20_g8883, partial [Candolleomyces eurysporus]